MEKTKVINGELIIKVRISNLIKEDELQEVYQGSVHKCVQDIAKGDGILRNVDPNFCQILLAAAV